MRSQDEHSATVWYCLLKHYSPSSLARHKRIERLVDAVVAAFCDSIPVQKRFDHQTKVRSGAQHLLEVGTERTKGNVFVSHDPSKIRRFV
jgi:hypothetical protein